MSTDQSTKKETYVRKETWTPSDAEKALSSADVNRNLRPYKVDNYARDMANNDWKVDNAQTIKFDWRGHLIDGQHRVAAQIKAGMQMSWWVARDCPDDVQDTIDTGIPRTLADILGFRGEEHAQLLGAVTRMVRMVIRDNMASTRFNLTSTEVLDTLETHPEIRASVELAWWSKGKALTPIPPSVAGTAHWMITRINGIEEADRFITRVVTLQGEDEGSPVLALARRLNEMRRIGARMHQKDVLALTLKAWNYEAEGKHVQKLMLGAKGKDNRLPTVKRKPNPVQERPDSLSEPKDAA